MHGKTKIMPKLLVTFEVTRNDVFSKITKKLSCVLKQINVDSRLYLEVIRTNQVLSVMLDAIGRDEIPPE